MAAFEALQADEKKAEVLVSLQIKKVCLDIMTECMNIIYKSD